MTQPYYENQRNPPIADNYSKAGSAIKYILWTLAAVIILVVLINTFREQSINTANATAQIQAENRDRINTRNNITQLVRATSSNFQTRGIGGIFNLDITVNNSTKYLLEDVSVLVTYIKADGDVYKKEIVDFPYVSPNGYLTVMAPTSDRGIRVTYQIIKIKSAALGL
jgi:hypothetical protein